MRRGSRGDVMKYSNDLPTCDQLLALYADAGPSACTSDPLRLLRAVEHSLCVATAWENDQLVGLARAIGDGETILYIQDVLVHSSFHHSGIGAQLMSMLLRAYPDVLQVVLLADDSPASAGFYTGLGFAPATGNGLTAFIHFG